MAKIFLAEDDIELSEKIAKWLKMQNHEVETVADGIEAAGRVRFCHYDLLILDWDLPGVTGIEVCRQFRALHAEPVLMLTGKSTIDDKEQGFSAGADDYLTKPFNLRELSMRIEALLRRPAEFAGSTLTVAHLTLDTKKHQLFADGKLIHLEPKEFALLEFFMRHPDVVFSADALFDRVWHSESDSSPDTVRTHIKNLRRKLAADPEQAPIKTVYRLGYKLETKP